MTHGKNLKSWRKATAANGSSAQNSGRSPGKSSPVRTNSRRLRSSRVRRPSNRPFPSAHPIEGGGPDRPPVVGGKRIHFLECADGSYCTGITRRPVEERVSEHAQGLIARCYTSTRRPVKLVFEERYEHIADAIAAERRIKGWSRAKKEAYMRGDFASLVQFSKSGASHGSAAEAPTLAGASFDKLRTRFAGASGRALET